MTGFVLTGFYFGLTTISKDTLFYYVSVIGGSLVHSVTDLHQVPHITVLRQVVPHLGGGSLAQRHGFLLVRTSSVANIFDQAGPIVGT